MHAELTKVAERMQAILHARRSFGKGLEAQNVLRWALGEVKGIGFEKERLVSTVAAACQRVAAPAAEMLRTSTLSELSSQCRSASQNLQECLWEPRLLSLSLVGRSDPRRRINRPKGESHDKLKETKSGWRQTAQRSFAFHHFYPTTVITAPIQAEEWYLKIAESQLKEPVTIPASILEGEADEEEAVLASNPEQTATENHLFLLSAAANLPHPDKVAKGGEDAHFITTAGCCSAAGVFDGVGGWAAVGIDAGIYARELSGNAVLALQAEPAGAPDPSRVLTRAHQRTKSKGSSTACILMLTSENTIQAANLGDSGFLVIREGRLVFKSPSQQHDFNFPFQLGSEHSDSPEEAQVFQVPVRPGDVLVLGTDGLFDNVFDSELISVVMANKRAGHAPGETAARLAGLARVRAQDKYRQSPFSRAAHEAGYLYIGGKMDDITVVVSYVSERKTTRQELKSAPSTQLESSLGLRAQVP